MTPTAVAQVRGVVGRRALLLERSRLRARLREIRALLKAPLPPEATVSSNPAILALLADIRPGRCALCDEPLPRQPGRGRRRKYCGATDCERLYQTLYGIGRRQAQAIEGGV